MFFEFRMMCPSSDNGSSHCNFRVLVQVENERSANRRDVMNDALVKIVILLLPREAHLSIIESVDLCWTKDLHHTHVIGCVFLVIL